MFSDPDFFLHNTYLPLVIMKITDKFLINFVAKTFNFASISTWEKDNYSTSQSHIACRKALPFTLLTVSITIIAPKRSRCFLDQLPIKTLLQYEIL